MYLHTTNTAERPVYRLAHAAGQSLEACVAEVEAPEACAGLGRAKPSGELYCRCWELPSAERQGRWQPPHAHECRGTATCLQRLLVPWEGLQTWWLGRFHRCITPDLRTTVLPPAVCLPASYLDGLPLNWLILASHSLMGCCCLVCKGAGPELPLVPCSRYPVPHSRLRLLPDGCLLKLPNLLPVLCWHCLAFGKVLIPQRWLPG